MQARTPNFLIIGAQKCGTSWLHSHLARHPDVFMPAKDQDFFAYTGHLQPPAVRDYFEQFQAAGVVRAIGEASASYFWTHSASPWCVMPPGFQTDIPGIVRQHLGSELKLIVILRHPVGRAVSAYLHYLAEGELAPTTTFEESMKYMGIIDMGFYARHLSAWLGAFDLSQIEVLTLENDIRDRPLPALSRVCEFLEITPPDAGEAGLGEVVYAGIPRQISAEGVYADLGKLPQRGSKGESAHPSNEYTQVLKPGQWQELESIYHADVARLDAILGTQLIDDWGFSGKG